MNAIMRVLSKNCDEGLQIYLVIFAKAIKRHIYYRVKHWPLRSLLFINLHVHVLPSVLGSVFLQFSKLLDCL